MRRHKTLRRGNGKRYSIISVCIFNEARRCALNNGLIRVSSTKAENRDFERMVHSTHYRAPTVSIPNAQWKSLYLYYTGGGGSNLKAQRVPTGEPKRKMIKMNRDMIIFWRFYSKEYIWGGWWRQYGVRKARGPWTRKFVGGIWIVECLQQHSSMHNSHKSNNIDQKLSIFNIFTSLHKKYTIAIVT